MSSRRNRRCCFTPELDLFVHKLVFSWLDVLNTISLSDLCYNFVSRVQTKVKFTGQPTNCLNPLVYIPLWESFVWCIYCLQILVFCFVWFPMRYPRMHAVLSSKLQIFICSLSSWEVLCLNFCAEIFPAWFLECGLYSQQPLAALPRRITAACH